MSKPEGFPDVEPPAVVLSHADARSNRVLDLGGKLFTGTGERFAVFSSLEAASEYADRKVKQDPTIECFIMDHEGKCIQSFLPEWRIRARRSS